VVALMRSIHPDFLGRVQPCTTSTRRPVQRAVAGLGGGPKGHAQDTEAWALEALRTDAALDLVVAGHSHLHAKVDAGAGRYYLSAGDWITHFRYVEIPENGSPPVIRKWVEGDSADDASSLTGSLS